MLSLDFTNLCQKKPLRGSPPDNPLAYTLFACIQWIQNKLKILSFFSCSIFTIILPGYPYPRFFGKKWSTEFMATQGSRSIIHRTFILYHCVATPEAVTHSCHQCLRLPDRFFCSFYSDILTFWNFCSDLWASRWKRSSCVSHETRPNSKNKGQQWCPSNLYTHKALWGWVGNMPTV